MYVYTPETIIKVKRVSIHIIPPNFLLLICNLYCQSQLLYLLLRELLLVTADQFTFYRIDHKWNYMLRALGEVGGESGLIILRLVNVVEYINSSFLFTSE